MTIPYITPKKLYLKKNWRWDFTMTGHCDINVFPVINTWHSLTVFFSRWVWEACCPGWTQTSGLQGSSYLSPVSSWDHRHAPLNQAKNCYLNIVLAHWFLFIHPLIVPEFFILFSCIMSHSPRNSLTVLMFNLALATGICRCYVI